MNLSEPTSLYPSDSRLIELPAGSKVAREDYRSSGVTPSDFLGLSGNVGMILDGQYLLVDIDAPNAEEARFLASRLDRESPTRTVTTPRGGSHRIYLLPAGFGGTNAKLNRLDGTPYADLKTLGYAVGPGSEVNGRAYELTANIAPIDAPAWLLDKVRRTEGVRAQVETRSGIPRGEHDDALHKLASYLRGQQALSPQAIARQLEAAVDGGLLVDQDESRPYTTEDFARLARSVEKYPAYVNPLQGVQLDSGEWESAADIELVGEPIKWLMHGFVPQGELVTMWGAGGIGKSTFAGWLAAQSIAKGHRVAVALVEEPFRRFAARAVLGGLSDRSRLLHMGGVSSFVFPRDAAALEAKIVQYELGLVYFDSIYSHFDSKLEGNEAQRARAVLSPLSEIAQRTGCTILGTFHENKAGDYLGSTAMLDVARAALHVTRKGKGPLRIKAHKYNLFDPGYRAQFEADEVTVVEPTTGAVQMEENVDGVLEPAKIKIARKIANTTEMNDTIETDQNGDAAVEVFQDTRRHRGVSDLI